MKNWTLRTWQLIDGWRSHKRENKVGNRSSKFLLLPCRNSLMHGFTRNLPVVTMWSPRKKT